MQTAVLAWLALVPGPLDGTGKADRDLTDRARAAVAKSLPLLQQSAAVYIKERTCFSCHHQALPALAIARAQERGFETNRKAALAQREFTLAYFSERSERMHKGTGVVGGPYTAGYALVGLAADGCPPDATTDGLVAYLLQTQEEDGHWRIHTHRPPLEDSDFTATALALRGLGLFCRPEQKEEISRRTRRALHWLEKARPRTHEDRVFHLLGLKWAGGRKASRSKAAEALLEQQRKDGGWGQLADLPADPYATGQALVALHQAGGVPVDAPAYRRGARFLLSRQLEDGSWLVKSRSRPFQKPFDSAFPHGENQWISISGTSWATMALTLLVPEKGRGDGPTETPPRPARHCNAEKPGLARLGGPALHPPGSGCR